MPIIKKYKILFTFCLFSVPVLLLCFLLLPNRAAAQTCPWYGLNPCKIDECGNIKDVDTSGACFVLFAKDAKDVNICPRITSESQRSRCYAELAKDLNRDDLCLKATDESSRSSCFLESAIKKGDCNILTEQLDGVTWQLDRDRCFYNLGWSKADPNLCNQISSSTDYYEAGWRPGSKDDCLREIVVDTNRGELCDQVQKNKQLCFTAAAQGGDLSYCNKLQGFDREQCISNSIWAIRLSNQNQGTYCNEVSNPQTRDACFFGAAATTGSKNWCASIQDSSIKRACGFFFSRLQTALYLFGSLLTVWIILFLFILLLEKVLYQRLSYIKTFFLGVLFAVAVLIPWSGIHFAYGGGNYETLPYSFNPPEFNLLFTHVSILHRFICLNDSYCTNSGWFFSSPKPELYAIYVILPLIYGLLGILSLKIRRKKLTRSQKDPPTE